MSSPITKRSRTSSFLSNIAASLAFASLAVFAAACVNSNLSLIYQPVQKKVVEFGLVKAESIVDSEQSFLTEAAHIHNFFLKGFVVVGLVSGVISACCLVDAVKVTLSPPKGKGLWSGSD